MTGSQILPCNTTCYILKGKCMWQKKSTGNFSYPIPVRLFFSFYKVVFFQLAYDPAQKFSFA